MPEVTELLHSNLYEVFGERDPERRWAAIGRTYTEDVTFTDPDGEVTGWQALNDRAQELLIGPPQTTSSKRTAQRTLAPTRPRWRGASGLPASQSPAASISSRFVTAA